ncbi:unnamed protein product [Wuchereria bancrofti]|uniref:Uncharacterized protein n=4 Tax=Wuchereria bancrofti TaxID=6293 RepID=A0A3P7DUK4_WUCBA|nr:unnamed protein product [Wuchereria bancrofti]
MSSGKEILCKAISYCYHLLFATTYGKFEEFGCDEPKNQQLITFTYTLPTANYQQICISSGFTKLCHCTELKCNEQWIVNTMQRELNIDQMLYLLIGLAFIIISWNVLLCHINWQCKKITLSRFSLLLSCNTLTSTQKCSLVLHTLKIIVLACLLLASWIPATMTCNNRGIIGRHIVETIFLPQIFNNSSPLSLIFIPFGFLPLLHITILAFCMIISKESSHIRAIKTFMIYYDFTFATVYYLSAYFMSKTVNSFGKLYHLECTVKMKHWMVAVIFAYLIGFLYMISAFLLIIVRSIEGSSKKKENNLVNEDKAESPGQVSTVSLSTAHSVPLHSNYGTIEFSPQPFVVSNGCSGILNLKNTYFNQWIAIRILANNNKLTIHPNKFLLPPERTSAAEVTITNDIANEEISNRLLVQWYVIGAYCPARNVNTLWTRPHYVPRDQWHYKIIRVYSDLMKF